MPPIDERYRIYNPEFHKTFNKGSIIAAEKILPILFNAFRIQSIVDFGCGEGTWLSVAKKLGAIELTGIEGPWASKWMNNEIIPKSDFTLILQDLEEPLSLQRHFDLAISIEIAEHLTQERAASFVEDLCAASTRVLFSAAIPGQGGDNHLNEQWHSFWAEIFSHFSYRPIDCIRPQTWDEDDIPVHYRQNCLLFVHESEHAEIYSDILNHQLVRPLNVVHPALWSDYMGLTTDKLNLTIDSPHIDLIITRGILGMEGFGKPEGPYPQWDLPRVRWAKKNRVCVKFYNFDEKEFKSILISMSFRPQVRPAAQMKVKFNGEEIKNYKINGAKKWHDDNLNLISQEGLNAIELLFPDSDEVPPPLDSNYILFKKLSLSGVKDY